MKNQIKTLEIKNFKTIKDSKKIDCKRINIFIGKPNVGKSNILEAISLLGATYSQNKEKFLSDLIRYENFENLFYDNEIGNKIEVISNVGVTYIKYHSKLNLFDLIFASKKEFISEISGREENINDGRFGYPNYAIPRGTTKKSSPFQASINAVNNNLMHQFIPAQ